MKTIFSNLEDNIFSGILVKKGLNNFSDREYQKLCQNRHFLTAWAKEFILAITPVTPDVKQVVAEIKPNFDSMSYNELKKYVKDNNIETASMKKADILTALKG